MTDSFPDSFVIPIFDLQRDWITLSGEPVTPFSRAWGECR